MRCYASIADLSNDIFGTQFVSGPPYTYGSMVALAFAVGTGIGYYELYKREKLNILLPQTNKYGELVSPKSHLIYILCIALIGAILGSKILEISSIAQATSFIKNPFGDTGTGLTVLGGLWGGLLPLYFYFKYNKLQMAYFIDALTPTFLISSMIGRLGCQLSGDGCWGIASDMNQKPSFIPDFLWGQVYPNNIIDKGYKIPDCVEAHCYILDQAVFPTPIYEIILIGLISILILYCRKKWMHIPFVTFGCALMLYGIERFIIEFIRINEKISLLGLHWTRYQWVSLAMLVLGIYTLFFQFTKIKNKHEVYINKL